ncbi:MAG TPA: enoyl-CoA hydratase-related protein [Methylibium sp.]|nr:enoyl-CoA hydratase-related protein [Methylibium sp.]
MVDTSLSRDHVLAEIDGALGTITLNRPQRHNALDLALATDLLDVLHGVLARPTVRCVLLRAAGTSFGVGGDIAAFVDEAQAVLTARRLLALLHGVVRVVRQADRPVVCAVQGAAAGGSLGLALACDVGVWAADARLVPAYAKLGASPDCGLSWTLSRALGPQRALEWLLDGSSLSATQAQALGLVRHVVEPDALQAQARGVAERLSELSAVAVVRTKQLIARASRSTLDEQLDGELQSFIGCVATEPFRSSVQALAVASKRGPCGGEVHPVSA